MKGPRRWRRWQGSRKQGGRDAQVLDLLVPLLRVDCGVQAEVRQLGHPVAWAALHSTELNFVILRRLRSSPGRMSAAVADWLDNQGLLICILLATHDGCVNDTRYINGQRTLLA